MSQIGRARLGRTVRAALLSGAGLLAGAQAARAQFAFEDDVLPPRVVAWRLADRGFSRLSRPRFDGRVYVVDAVSPTGVPVRLFVDPAVGAIVGRRPLGPPEAYARLEPPRPGFGWTEEDVRPAPRTLPGEAAPSARPARRPGAEAARPEVNPYGVNPDGPARADRPAAEPRRVARVAPPARRPGAEPDLKPALRTAPEAPAPQIPPAQVDRGGPDKAPEGRPEATAAAAPPAKASPEKPAAERPDAAPAKPEGARAEAAKPGAGPWQDPPADRRPVRVIGGATVVPGAGPAGKEPEPAP